SDRSRTFHVFRGLRRVRRRATGGGASGRAGTGLWPRDSGELGTRVCWGVSGRSGPSSPARTSGRSPTSVGLRLLLLAVFAVERQDEDAHDDREREPQRVAVDDREDVDGGLAQLVAQRRPDDREKRTPQDVGGEEQPQ